MRRLTATSPTGRPRISARPEVGYDQLHQQLQRRRLAGAVRAEKAEHLALTERTNDTRVERQIRAWPPEPDLVVLGERLGANRVHAADARASCPARADARVHRNSRLDAARPGGLFGRAERPRPDGGARGRPPSSARRQWHPRGGPREQLGILMPFRKKVGVPVTPSFWPSSALSCTFCAESPCTSTRIPRG